MNQSTANEPTTAESCCCAPGACASTGYDVETTVRQRYAAGAQQVQPSLCCPTSYDPQYLRIIPQEILEKDYGCGDPSAYVQHGETVLDLGSGAGKICYILAQKVGAAGRVIGVDFNDAMLELARKHQPMIIQSLGYDNVRFAKGRIQDLALDLAAAQQWLDQHPLTKVEDVAAFDAHCQQLRATQKLVADDSVDVVVSNCVLNLVQTGQKEQLFAEIFRVLKRGGRAVISDIVCDEPPTQRILNDPELWSGCIAGAFVEDEFLKRFEDAGFHGIEILARSAEPWQVIDGIEFRSLTVRAYKGKQGPCLDRLQAVVYRGPWRSVTDDDGHTLQRGERSAVCEKTYNLYLDPAGPYAGQLIGIEPAELPSLDEAADMSCAGVTWRDPKVSKGGKQCMPGSGGGDCCGAGGKCC